MFGDHVTRDELRAAVRTRDLTTITKWVYQGRLLFFEDSRPNLYHFLVKYSTLDFVEEVLRTLPETIPIIRETDTLYEYTSLHECCILAGRDSGHTVGVLDVLCRVAGVEALADTDGKGRTCEEVALIKYNYRLQRFLQWRASNPDGMSSLYCGFV